MCDRVLEQWSVDGRWSSLYVLIVLNFWKKKKLFHGESIHLDSPTIIMYVRCAPCPKPVIDPVWALNRPGLWSLASGCALLRQFLIFSSPLTQNDHHTQQHMCHLGTLRQSLKKTFSYSYFICVDGLTSWPTGPQTHWWDSHSSRWPAHPCWHDKAVL